MKNINNSNLDGMSLASFCGSRAVFICLCVCFMSSGCFLCNFVHININILCNSRSKVYVLLIRNKRSK